MNTNGIPARMRLQQYAAESGDRTAARLLAQVDAFRRDVNDFMESGATPGYARRTLKPQMDSLRETSKAFRTEQRMVAEVKQASVRKRYESPTPEQQAQRKDAADLARQRFAAAQEYELQALVKEVVLDQQPQIEPEEVYALVAACRNRGVEMPDGADARFGLAVQPWELSGEYRAAMAEIERLDTEHAPFLQGLSDQQLEEADVVMLPTGDTMTMVDLVD